MKWKDLHKIGISGSRRFPDLSRAGVYFDRYITKNFPDLDRLIIITGGAIGIDSHITSICARRGIKYLTIPARWLELHKAAGPKRNKHIVDLADEMFIFWNGKSKRTQHALNFSKESGKQYKLLTPDRLKKLVKIKPVTKIVVPKKASNAQAHKMRELIKQADLEDMFGGDDKIDEMYRRKKRKNIWD